jgi:copper chaperone CopZ
MRKRPETRSKLLAVGVCVCVLGVALTYGCSRRKADESPQTRLMRVTFSVPMMDCTVCATKTKMALEAFGGVDKAYANFLEKKAWARFDPNMVDPEQMRKAIDNLGLKNTTIVSIEPWKPDPLPEPG